MFSPSLWQARSPHRHRVTPHLECLEARDCPAAPTFLSFGVTPLSGNLVTLMGTIQDENPSSVQITFSGVVNGSTTPNPLGGFALMTTADSLGTIFANAMDDECLTDEDSADLTSDVPVIEDFTATDLGSGYYMFQGHVIDEAPVGLGVLLTGLPSFGDDGITAYVDFDSWFSVLHNIGTDTGTVQAQTWDIWGQASDPVFALIR